MAASPNLPNPRRLPLCIALAGILAISSSTAAAQDPRHQEPTTLETVEVHATPLPGTADNLTLPVEVLAGEKLDEAKANTLGETVGKLPGVQSSYFGPGVGRPIVRGLDGARVQVLSDGLGSGDVSTVSADHAVSIEPFLADQIEVLKGPATLLYGSGAIGGAVNVVDGRVPDTVTDQPLQGRAEGRVGSVNNEKTGVFRLDGTSASGHLVFHADALHRESGDYEIPGFSESAALFAAEGETPDPAEAGILPNSFVRTDSAALGMSWIGSGGFVGVSASLFNTRYGIPGHAHGHQGEEPTAEGEDVGAVQIGLDQHRSELRGGLDDFGPFQSLRVKLADTRYTHTEFEGEAVGTVFDNDSTEGRLELVHKPWAGWTGALGLQLARREFVAIGDEAFVPGSRSRDAGVFWIGQRSFGPVKLELGARHDRNRIDIDDAIAIGPDREFGTTSLSASAKWQLADNVHLLVGLDRAQRSPTPEELYSNGVHVATQSVELGNPQLDIETANRAEIGMHWHGGPVKLSVSLYHTRFADFIYLADTGTLVDELPQRQWSQADARFTGGEAALDWAIADNASGSWDLRVFGDRVHAQLDDGGNQPRIVPARLGGELRWKRAQWRASVGAIRSARQDEVAAFESETPGYTLVDAHLAWHTDTPGGNAWEVFVDGSNLLDAEARPHTSFLKDLSPLPGRGFVVGVRAFF